MGTGIRIIGDAHGKIDWNILGRPSYLDLIADRDASVQLGDMGDEEAYALLGERVDPLRHRFLPGNHDDYDRLPPHSLGDFGVAALGGVEFFFVRGAFSVDKALRLKSGIPWWPQEELDEAAMDRALAAYAAARPAIVLSHDCPTVVSRILGDVKVLADYGFDRDTFETRTGLLFQKMLDLHRPRLWAFGHYHRNWKLDLRGTTFRCLGELSCLDLDRTGSVER
jgi:hypothetical protein